MLRKKLHIYVKVQKTWIMIDKENGYNISSYNIFFIPVAFLREIVYN